MCAWYYDESTIFENYPLGLTPLPGTFCTLSVNTRLFERYVFRPIVGHDILRSQTRNDDIFSSIEYDSNVYFYMTTQEELSQRIQYDLRDYDNRNWTPYANKMAAYIWDNVDDELYYKLDSELGWGRLYVQDERNDWPDENQPQIATDTCSICQENLSDQVAARMGLPCGHVFDKECLTQWIWTNPSCPICRATL